jgi:uncharacterized protein (DUF952 family)
VRKDVLEGAYVEAGQSLLEIADLSTVWIEAEVYEADIEFLREGQTVEATVEAFRNRVFTGKVSLVHPHVDPATRTNAVRFELENPDHKLRPGMFATVRIKTPLSEIEPFASLAKESEVLAVPERAVIDTGSKQIVYVERAPGQFDGVQVQLGPRAGGFYPLIEGLELGDRIAAAGSFLIDAETRLNPAAAATYVGASGGPQSGRGSRVEGRGPEPQSGRGSRVEGRGPEPQSGRGSRVEGRGPEPQSGRGSRVEGRGPETKADEKASGEVKKPSADDLMNIDKLAPADRELALAQRFCPVSGEPLGSMGVPHKLTIKGHTIFLCCKGCDSQVHQQPEKFVEKVAELKAEK